MGKTMNNTTQDELNCCSCSTIVQVFQDIYWIETAQTVCLW